jgi:hypothetical protein
MRNKMKYQNNPLVLTIIEDNAKIITDKVKDRGENPVLATKVHR